MTYYLYLGLIEWCNNISTQHILSHTNSDPEVLRSVARIIENVSITLYKVYERFNNNSGDWILLLWTAQDRRNLLIYKFKSGETFVSFPYLIPQKIIGEGAYACVSSAIDTRTKKKYAIKKNRNAFVNIGDAKRILREIKLMYHFRGHNNLMSVIDVIGPDIGTQQKFNDVYLIMPKMHMTLSKLIMKSSIGKIKIYEQDIETIMYELTYINGDWCETFGKNRQFKLQFKCANNIIITPAYVTTVFKPIDSGCEYEFQMSTYRGCPTECVVDNDQLCSGLYLYIVTYIAILRTDYKIFIYL